MLSLSRECHSNHFAKRKNIIPKHNSDKYESKHHRVQNNDEHELKGLEKSQLKKRIQNRNEV